MSKFIVGASVTLALALPAVAQAKPPTPQHVQEYNHLRAEVIKKDGKRAPGRNIIRWGLSNHHKATDANVVRSNGVFYRILHPQPVVRQTVAATYGQTAVVSPTPTTSSYSTGTASGGLVSCIINHESTSPTVVNSSGHGGIGQWSQSTWQEDLRAEGKVGYPSSPTSASYSQQYSVLQGEGSTPQGFGQQTNYDPC